MSALADRLDAARADTLALVAELGDDALAARPHEDFSPIGWHLGHLAYTEAYWLHGRCRGDDALWRPYARAFAQGGRPKDARRDLPPRAELLGYLEAVRERSRAHLLTFDVHARAPLERDGYAAWLVECHEHQHRETVAVILGLGVAPEPAEATGPPRRGQPPAAALEDDGEAPMALFDGGEHALGTDAVLAYDNERREHGRTLAPFRLDAHPVTSAAWQRFMADGGYGDARLWTEEGWRWRESHGIDAPRGWRVRDGAWHRRRLDGVRAVDGREPVCGVSWFEADAFARWRGARLPTEAEWERAARAHAVAAQGPTALGLTTRGPTPVHAAGEAPAALLGQVWEWTASAFEPYPGFEPFPYAGYSSPYFGDHVVLRGGSFATSPVIARPTFRNWYLPHVREIFSGLRCATDA